jgi:hypothetical protein
VTALRPPAHTIAVVRAALACRSFVDPEYSRWLAQTAHLPDCACADRALVRVVWARLRRDPWLRAGEGRRSAALFRQSRQLHA